MSCKPTHEGQRFDNTNQIKDHIKQLPLSEQKRIMSSDTLDFIQKRANYQNQLLEIFDPQTVLEISQSISNLTTFVIDSLHNGQYSSMSRDKVIKTVGKDAIFQGVFNSLSNSFFTVLKEVSFEERPLNSKNLKIIKNYCSLFNIPIEKIINNNDDGTYSLDLKIQSAFISLKHFTKNTPEERRIYANELRIVGFTMFPEVFNGIDYFENYKNKPIFMAMLFQSSLQLRHNEGIVLGRKFDYVADTELEQFYNDMNKDDFDYEDPEEGNFNIFTDRNEQSAYGSLPKQIRTLLSKLPKQQRIEGTDTYVNYKDALGLDAKLDPGFVFGVLVNLLSGTTTRQQMMNVLENSVSSYPFIGTLLQRIGDDPVIKPKLFSTFRKDFQPYAIQVFDPITNSIEIMVVNRNNSVENSLSIIKSNIESFTVLHPNSYYNSNGRITPTTLENFLSFMESSDIKNRIDPEGDPNRNIEVINNSLIPKLKAIGVPVDETTWNVIKSQISNNQFFKYNLLSDIELEISALIKSLPTVLENNNGIPVMTFNRNNFSKGSKAYYKNIAIKLAKLQPVILDKYVRAGDSSYYSNVYPTFLGSIISNLKQARKSIDGIKNYIESNWTYSKFFNKKSPFSIHSNHNLWLRELASKENADNSDLFDWTRDLSFANTDSFNKEESLDYADLTPERHKEALFHKFYSFIKNGSNDLLANYPLFITGDIEALRFIQFRHYGLDTLVDNAMDYFSHEIWKLTELIPYWKENNINLDILKKYPVGSNFRDTLRKYNFSQLQFLNNPEYKDRIINILTREDPSFKFNDLSHGERSDAVRQIKSIIKEGLLNNAESYFKNNKEDILKKDNEYNSYTTLPLNLLYDISRIMSVNDSFIKEGMDVISIKDSLGKDVTLKDIANTDIAARSIGNLKNITVTIQKGNKIENKTLYDFIGEFMMKYQYINHYMGMTNQISMLTIDPMFYKGEKDLQKRFKEMIASGTVLDMDAIDPYNSELGNPSYYLPRDVNGKTKKRNIIYFKDENIPLNEELKSYLSKFLPNTPEGNEVLKSVIKDGSSLTDGIVYIGLDEYRAIKGSRGEWTDDHQSVYEDIKAGKPVSPEKAQIFNPLKPYTFGFEKDPMCPIPTQIKCSELVLIKELLPEDSKLRYLAEYIEDHSKDGFLAMASNTSVKVGNHANISIDVEDSKTFNSSIEFSDFIDNQILANPRAIHQLDYNDYKIQNNVPFSLYKQALLGVQSRKLILIGLNQDKMYKYVPDKNGNYREMSGKELKNFFDNLLVDEFIDAASNLKKQMDTDVQFNEVLANQMLNHDRYISDILNYFKVDNKGNSVVSTSDFVFKDNIEMSLTALIDKIRQIKVTGGSAVNASSYGIKLNMEGRFSGKDGVRTLGFHKNADGTIDMECVMPMYNKKLFEPFMDKITGRVDMKAAGEAGLLEIIGYRIPTEHHYSMFNIRIVDFCDAAGGGVIYLPAEITKLAGLDFDIDKLFFMFRNFSTTEDENGNTTSVKYLGYDFDSKENTKEQRHNAIFEIILNRLRDTEITDTKYKPQGFEKAKIAAKLQKLFTRFSVSELEKLLNIGVDEFDDPAIIEKLKNHPAFTKLNSTELEIPLDYADIDTHSIYADQNKLAAKLIGIFANQSVNRALGDFVETMELKESITFCGNSLKKLNSRKITRSYWTKDSNGNYVNNTITVDVSETASEFTGASVDAVKEPVLIFLNLNEKTANVAGVLGRLGYTLDEIGLLLNQPIIKELVKLMQNGASYDSALFSILGEYGLNLNDLKNVRPNVNAASMAHSTMIHKLLKEQSMSESKRLEYVKKLNAYQIQVLSLFDTLNDTSSDYNDQILNSRQTSSSKNHSGYAGIIYKRLAMDRFASEEGLAASKINYGNKAPMSNNLQWNTYDELRNELNKVDFKYEQALFEIATKEVSRLFNDRVKFLQKDIYELVKFMNTIFSDRIFDKKTIDTILSDFLRYNISEFGYLNYTSFWSDIDKFLDIPVIDTDGILSISPHHLPDETGIVPTIPQRVRMILNTYPNIAKLPLFNALNTEKIINGANVIGLQSENRWTIGDKNVANMTWKLAMNLPTTLEVEDINTKVYQQLTFTEEEKEIAKKLSEFLMYYNYHTYGISWNPNSILNLSPLELRENIPGYLDGLKDFDKLDHFEGVLTELAAKKIGEVTEYSSKNRKILNFTQQFALMNKDNYKITPSVYLRDINYPENFNGKKVVIGNDILEFTAGTVTNTRKDLPIIPAKLIINKPSYISKSENVGDNTVIDETAFNYKPCFNTPKGFYIAEAFLENPTYSIKGTTIRYVKLKNPLNSYDPSVDTKTLVNQKNDVKFLTLSASNNKLNINLNAGKFLLRRRFGKVLEKLQKFNFLKSQSDLYNSKSVYINSSVYNKNGVYDHAYWAYKRNQLVTEFAKANLIEGFHYLIHENNSENYHSKKIEFIYDGYNPILTDEYYTIETIELEHLNGSSYSSGEVKLNNTIIGNYNIPENKQNVNIELYPQYDNPDNQLKVKKGVVKFLVEKGIQFPESVLTENEINQYALNFQEDTNISYPNDNVDNIPSDMELISMIQDVTGLDATEAFYAAKPSIDYIREKLERIDSKEVFDKFGNKLC